MDDSFQINVRDISLKIKTKPGVFSAKKMDDGTRLLLDNIETPLNKDIIADLGTGAGIIGFTLAKLNIKAHVHLLDDHVRSIELAQENADLNKLKNVEVYLSDLFSAVDKRTYHHIISNPPQQLGNEFLEELINECYKHLKEDGTLWLVVKNNVKPFMIRLTENIFKNCTIVAHSREHTLLKAIR